MFICQKNCTRFSWCVCVGGGCIRALPKGLTVLCSSSATVVSPLTHQILACARVILSLSPKFSLNKVYY